MIEIDELSGFSGQSHSLVTCIYTSIRFKERIVSVYGNYELDKIFENDKIIVFIGNEKLFFSLIHEKDLMNESFIFSIPESRFKNHRVQLGKLLTEYGFSSQKNLFFNEKAANNKKLLVYETMDLLCSNLGKLEANEIINDVNKLFLSNNLSNKEKNLVTVTIYTEYLRIYMRFNTIILKQGYLLAKARIIKDSWKRENIEEFKNSICDFFVFLNAIVKANIEKDAFINVCKIFIDENYMRDINMTVASNELNMNYSYFSFRFKEAMGECFNSYLRKVRVEKAKKLLENSCLSIKEISENTGFNSEKYFFRIFKETTGVTPGEYKKNFNI